MKKDKAPLRPINNREAMHQLITSQQCDLRRLANAVEQIPDEDFIGDRIMRNRDECKYQEFADQLKLLGIKFPMELIDPDLNKHMQGLDAQGYATILRDYANQQLEFDERGNRVTKEYIESLTAPAT